MRGFKNIVVVIFFLLGGITIYAHETKGDSLDVRAYLCHDTIKIKIVSYEIKNQLTFLMQGLTVKIEQPDTLFLRFPSASMVKQKVKRHPNEVKAELSSKKNSTAVGIDTLNNVVRPDVNPLVVALNDTTASIEYKDTILHTRNFNICVNKEMEEISFNIDVEASFFNSINFPLKIWLISNPLKGKRKEFSGKRLSGENCPLPDGMGEGISEGDEDSRKFRKEFIINLWSNHNNSELKH